LKRGEKKQVESEKTYTSLRGAIEPKNGSRVGDKKTSKTASPKKKGETAGGSPRGKKNNKEQGFSGDRENGFLEGQKRKKTLGTIPR